MKRTIVRHGSIAAIALTLSLGLAACGGDSEGDTAAKDDSTSMATTESSPSESESTMTDAGADTFGAGCSAIPTDGKGSFDGMVTDPVATAASNNPLLKTLVAAVTEADLVDTLNSAPALTVFAPTDDAFGKIPKKDLDAVLADKPTLQKILTHHVVEGQLGPDEIVGTHDTLAGDTITIKGDLPELTANEATIICGNIPTANATVYVIDTVMMPKM
ncbi:MAG: fasciclin domain-containing protein [Nocardioides sp.]